MPSTTMVRHWLLFSAHAMQDCSQERTFCGGPAASSCNTPQQAMHRSARPRMVQRKIQNAPVSRMLRKPNDPKHRRLAHLHDTRTGPLVTCMIRQQTSDGSETPATCVRQACLQKLASSETARWTAPPPSSSGSARIFRQPVSLLELLFLHSAFRIEYHRVY